jgi:hypothetical protein
MKESDSALFETSKENEEAADSADFGHQEGLEIRPVQSRNLWIDQTCS